MMWIAAVALAVALLGAGLARYVPPETWWGFQLVAVVLPYLAVSLTVLAILAGVAQRWGLVALCMLPVCLVMALAAFHGEQNDTLQVVTPNSESAWLRVMTFNAKPEAIGPGGIEALETLLAEERPHLVALQEFPLRRFESGQVGGSTLIVPFLRDQAYELIRPERTGDVNITRPIFSRIEAVGAAETAPSSVAEEREALWQSGGFTRALYRWDGTTIAIYNVHLHSFGKARPWQESRWEVLSPVVWAEALRAYKEDFRIRAEQSRAIRRLLEVESHPFLVCGDFNSTPGSWVYHHLRRGLRDAFAEAGVGWGATFPARLPLIRIDYVLASKEWDVRHAHVEDVITSDHRPILAHLRLRTPRTAVE